MQMNNLEPPQVPAYRLSICDRHPDEPVTGFCASCLRERLAGLDPANQNPNPNNNNNRLKTSTTSALKAIFRGNNQNHHNKPSSSSNGGSSSFFPELRRSKSFSGGRGERFSGVIIEPQRKSCDVRVRNTLSSLFHLDSNYSNHVEKGAQSSVISNNEVLGCENIDVDSRNLGGFSGGCGIEKPVFESKEEEDEEEEDEEVEELVSIEEEEVEDVVSIEEEELEELVPVEEGEIQEEIRRFSENGVVTAQGVSTVVEERVGEIEEVVEIEEEKEEAEEEVLVEEDEILMEEVKTMKDHINLESQCKKPTGGRDLKEIAGSFWLAASVFSKKLQKWRKKQKMKKRENGRNSASMRVEQRAGGRRFRETQSEIADYGFGRRSCDTDPRFSLDAGRMSLDAGRMSMDAGRMSLDAGRMSLDAGRMSFDDPRHSWDEPRASWDGYLMGRMFPRIPPMVSVTEDAPAPVHRIDNQIPVEESFNDDITMAYPGGSFQTKDYYADSLKRKSLDRSNSVRKMVAEVDEMKFVSNSKVSPANIDYFNVTKLDRDSRESTSNSLRDDRSESFDSSFRDAAGDHRKGSKKSRRWSKAWNIWGFIHRKGGNKDEEERYCRGNVVDRSFSESWPELRRDISEEARMGYNRNSFRSISSVSWRHSSSNNGGLFGSRRKSSAETNGHSKKRKEEFMLERNRSARYSPNNVDKGLLRFYLTPLRSSRRNGLGKSRPNNSHSIASSVLRMY
ncbi:hypothetical protein MKW94_024330 [Papaver nudicaule]|uniref:Uncharacterized protein n=1 Tax=Papaver nudicaule TaxID=74823 RepID=A0AA41VIE3_PAPNU|nr:hypothetical protein [Papaver nudicaule]